MDPKLMNRLAEVLSEIVKAKFNGSWKEKAEEIRLQMNERDAGSDLDEFTSWFLSDD